MSRLSVFLHRGHGPSTLADESSIHSSHHASWPETFVNPHDGSTMGLIPGGAFTMGSTLSDIEHARGMDKDGEIFALSHETHALSHETPQFEIFVPAFYLSVFTVTNEQFARFLTDLHPGRTTLEFWVYSTPHILQSQREGEPYRAEAGFEHHPAVHITWFGAEAYCRWAKLRLPTEVEWEKAARSTDARLFPWGNEWDDRFLCWHRGERDEKTAKVDAYSEGRSPYGIFQMAGNVAEWCDDWYQPRFYDEHAMGNRHSPHSGDEKVLRGGSCLTKHELEFRCSMRAASSPISIWDNFAGVRCACDLPGVALG